MTISKMTESILYVLDTAIVEGAATLCAAGARGKIGTRRTVEIRVDPTLGCAHLSDEASSTLREQAHIVERCDSPRATVVALCNVDVTYDGARRVTVSWPPLVCE